MTGLPRVQGGAKAPKGLTVRGRNQHFLSTHRNITEDPYGSNRDNRPDKADERYGITKAQEALASWLVGTAWCGTWAAWALSHAGVKGVSYRLASVMLIQEDARAGRGPFRDWQPPSAYKKVLRGDLVTWFGGAHVETVRGFKRIGGVVYVVTDGGNTSSGTSGSQSNGGGSFRRVRPLSQADGFARVDYPGGKVGVVVDRLAMRREAIGGSKDVDARPARGLPQSDLILAEQLKDSTNPDAKALLAAMAVPKKKATRKGTKP